MEDPLAFVIKLLIKQLSPDTAAYVSLSLIAIFAFRDLILKKKKKSKCAPCRFDVFVRQLELIRRATVPVEQRVIEQYAKQINNLPGVYSADIGRAITHYKAIVAGAFRFGDSEMCNLVIRNSIPDPSTASFKLFIEDNFSLYECVVLSHIADKWDKNILLISYQESYDYYSKYREVYKNHYQELILEVRAASKGDQNEVD